MKDVHFFLGRLGGTGKSIFAALVAQILLEQGKVLVWDVDPSIRTLSTYPSLHTQIIDMPFHLDWGFDNAGLHQILTALSNHEGHALIDSAPASYWPTLSWVLAKTNLDMLVKELGFQVFLHTTIYRSGRAPQLTNFLRDIPAHLPVNIVVWENHYRGNPPSDEVDALENASRQIIRIPMLTTYDMFIEQSLETMRMAQMTFSEFAASPDFGSFERHQVARHYSQSREKIMALLK